ncbi:serine/threonine protein kinase [Candidatus Uabimicrobium amorphum]|uniref:non-specific serine/threonine protein kinase n=1 Tax=Uabimicrobium amorphum TaxID=2596890 RepID=A0A5S9IRN6_UABAM|nr:serine/threonine-protein kinase [Candidatus Uabimicrobium amorphum]BBM86878.1 serine/threonine protein kinase [Candidatus Uabimicrobium amorphum]
MSSNKRKDDDLLEITNLKSNRRITQLGIYSLKEQIGAGGMGKVFKAYHPRLAKAVAIKVMMAQTFEEKRNRFFREARLMAKLKHPNIITVHDLGSESNIDYIVMDYIEGVSLDQSLKTTRFSKRKSLETIKKIALAIEYAHQHNIIHRDLKPSNIMMEACSGEPIVMDFGLAKDVDVPEMTKDGTVIGTPRYMSPEQAEGNIAKVTKASDIYSLGAILYEMLARTPAIQGNSSVSLMCNVLEGNIKSLREVSPKISVDLDTICMKALHKDPQQRYRSARKMAEDIQCFLENKPIFAKPRKKSFPVTTAVFCGVLILLGVIASVLFTQSEQRPKSPKSAKSSKLPKLPNTQNPIVAKDASWFVVKEKPYKVAYQVKKNWPVYFHQEFPTSKFVIYEVLPQTYVCFNFCRTSSSKLSDLLPQLEKSLFDGHYKFQRQQVSAHKIKNLRGQKITYRLYKENREYYGESFYCLHVNYIYVVTAICRKSAPELTILRESMSSVQSYGQVVAEGTFQDEIHEKNFHATYKIDRSWIKHEIETPPTEVAKQYWRGAASFIQFNFWVVPSSNLTEIIRSSLHNFFSDFYTYKVVKSSHRTGNGLRGKELLVHLKVKTNPQDKRYAKVFYKLANGNVYTVFYMYPEKENEAYFSPYEKALNSLKIR